MAEKIHIKDIKGTVNLNGKQIKGDTQLKPKGKRHTNRLELAGKGSACQLYAEFAKIGSGSISKPFLEAAASGTAGEWSKLLTKDNPKLKPKKNNNDSKATHLTVRKMKSGNVIVGRAEKHRLVLKAM